MTLLQALSEEDFSLTARVLTDAGMTSDLGGSFSMERIRISHDRLLATAAGGRGWIYKIISGQAPAAAGLIGIWENPWMGGRIHEIGWMILPAFQGRGLASRAVRTILAKARSAGKFDHVHAFARITNAPSNSLCEKMGFSRTEDPRSQA